MKASAAIVFALLPVVAHGHTVHAQGLFPSTCRSRREKLAYAVDVALHCGRSLNDVYNCLATLTNPLDLMECVKVFNTNNACKEAMSKGCGDLEPKCCRCKTNDPMSNHQTGCLLEIFKGDSSNDACKLLEYSSGRYPREWFRSGKDNYRFYGNCSDAEEKGGAKFTQHVMCPTPWADWH
uniref:Uncharacterized protein n=1 Tax=Pyrodinium bahamense TaxID=73915 RepID=A0A7S0A2A3_9DINO